jgi:hypothetical protein
MLIAEREHVTRWELRLDLAFLRLMFYLDDG